VLGVAALPVAFLAGAASAHVSVSADDPTQGGFAKITFRVPNETDSANTTRVAVFFPLTQPLASVSVQQLPGWSYQVKTHHLDKPISSDDGTVTEAVSEVVWTADSPASAIKPGEFEEFDVAAGPLPESPTMVFKALQTYSDGTVVRWIEPSTPGGPEPEHPAPTLTLVAADSGSGTGHAADPSTTSSTATSSSSSDGRATTALVLSILALVVAGAAVALVVVRRSRS
jgi:periplasmic copper chaperone A